MLKPNSVSGRHVRLLVVDNNQNRRNTACSILKDAGYSVDTAESGNQAIAKTQQTTYNLMLIALNLPDIPTNRLFTRIQETIPKIRKIVAADQTERQKAIAAVKQGANGYIIKTLEKEELLETVETQLEKQFSLADSYAEGVNVLFIGAHPDDVELGCGGTLIKHLLNRDNVYVLIFTNGEKGNAATPQIDRQQESLKALTLAGMAPSNIYFLQYPDTELWQVRQEVMNTITKFCETFQIQIIYTHSNKAQHQDHVTIFDETLRGARKAWGIMAYESHGATNPSFSPNLFVDITDVIPKKNRYA